MTHPFKGPSLLQRDRKGQRGGHSQPQTSCLPVNDGWHFHRSANTHLGSFSTMWQLPCHFWGSVFGRWMECAPSGFSGLGTEGRGLGGHNHVVWRSTHSTHPHDGLPLGRVSGQDSQMALCTVINECSHLSQKDLMIPETAGH